MDGAIADSLFSKERMKGVSQSNQAWEIEGDGGVPPSIRFPISHFCLRAYLLSLIQLDDWMRDLYVRHDFL